MSIFAPLGDRIQSLKFPRYMRFDSPSPTRRRHRSANVAACGRCSRPSSVPTRLQGNRVMNNAKPQFNTPIDLRKKMEYTVTESDSIERIAAIHDCTVGELMKMNRLGTRMVFPGQKLVVPCPMGEDDAFDITADNRFTANQAAASGGINVCKNEADGIRRGPGTAIQIHGRTATLSDPSSRIAVAKRGASRAFSEKSGGSTDVEVDNECLKRFIKLKVKQITETDGTVTGTLLVTPNALMFDPDVMHPLVLENGQDLYIMMARMEEVMSVAMFKDVSALTGAEGESEEIYDPDHEVTPVPERSATTTTKETADRAAEDLTDNVFEETDIQSPKILADDISMGTERRRSHETHIGHVASDSELPLIAEEGSKLSETDLIVPRAARRTYSDLSDAQKPIYVSKSGEMKAAASSRFGGGQQHSPEPSTSLDSAERSNSPLSRLGRTLSLHANTIRGSVTSGAGRMTQTAISGTKSVAHGVVSQSKAAAGTLQTGIQTSAKMAASHARTAVDAVAAMPQGITNLGTGLFSTSPQTDPPDEDNKKEMSKTSRGQNLATLLSLKEKTQQMREEAVKNKHLAHFVCATSMDEMPDLFKPVHELLSPAQTSSASERTTLTEPPYYMAVRLNRKKKYGKGRSATVDNVHSSAVFDEDVVGNRARKEFWFAIPKEKVDAIYHFLLQWNPEKYGASTQEENLEESIDQKTTRELLEDSGFVILDSETDERLSGWFTF